MWGHAQTPRRLPSERRRPVKRHIWLQFFLFLTLALILVGAVSGWQPVFAADDINPDTVGAGQLLLETGEGGYRSALSLDSHAEFRISGLIAEVSVSQSFRNDSQDWREALYVFPLPESAAVRSMQIRIGERVIEGEIHERAEAKRIYQAAKSRGKKAGLVEQERPNMFTTSVANIAPDETVIVELQYVQTVAYHAGEFSLRFPMTITPRYIPGDPLTEENTDVSYAVAGDGWAHATDQVPDAGRITPYQHPVPAGKNNPVNPITITADIDAGLPLVSLDSPWHDIRSSRQDDHYRIELARGPVSMSRDFELRWRPETGREPQAALFTETIDNRQYALLMLLPPAEAAAEKLLPREMVFVIDTSGSMGGVSIDQARQGLLLALDRLRPGDRFNVIEFNSVPDALFTQSRPVSPEQIRQAKRFVAGLQARGGTEMRAALERALNAESESGYLRQVIFMTDGAVGNEAALFKLIRERLGTSRLFTIGIGSAPNSYFMRKAARFGRGTFTYIGAASEVGQHMNELFSKLDAPVAGDLEVAWPGDMNSEAYPAKIPDLYQGEPLMVAARLDNFSGEVHISGRSADKAWRRELTLESRKQSPGIASVWARAKIESLLDEKTAGRPENEVRQDVLEVALTHHLVSPYTSFVAVDKTPSRPLDEALDKSSVANARPDGQSDQAYAWPATATNSRWNLFMGGLLLLLGLLIRFSYQGVVSRERYHDTL